MALPLDRNFLATPDTPTLVKNVPDSNEGPSVIRPTCLSHGCQCQQLRRLSRHILAGLSLVVVIPRGQSPPIPPHDFSSPKVSLITISLFKFGS